MQRRRGYVHDIGDDGRSVVWVDGNPVRDGLDRRGRPADRGLLAPQREHVRIARDLEIREPAPVPQREVDRVRLTLDRPVARTLAGLPAGTIGSDVYPPGPAARRHRQRARRLAAQPAAAAAVKAADG